jgi:hypothetical protein
VGPPKFSIEIFGYVSEGAAAQIIVKLFGAGELVFFGDPFESLGSALDPVGQAPVIFDGQLPHNLVRAARGVVAELRFVIDVLAVGIFVAHVRPFEVGFGLRTNSGYASSEQKRPARWPGVSFT